jgi:hypothetical protein
MVRSKFRCVVVAAAVTGAAVTLASSAVPAHAQGAGLAASRPSAAASLDMGAWSRLAGWLTDLWNDGLGLVVAADEALAPPENSACTGDCDRGGGVDPNG